MTQPQVPGSPSAGRVRTVVLAAVAGLVVGGGGVALAWALTGKSAATGTDADAQAVCGILGRTPDPTNFDQFGLPSAERWAAAANLADAVAAANSRYKPLANALAEAHTAVEQLNLPAVRAAAGKARQICAGL
jgi:hypothetical protein